MKRIIFNWPPGTGKSNLVNATTPETKGRFFSLSAANNISKYFGESEILIKALFELARKNKPAIFFIDKIDSVLRARNSGEKKATRRLKTVFLIQMQGVGKVYRYILVLFSINILGN